MNKYTSFTLALTQEQMLATFGHAALTDALLTVMDRRAAGQVHRVVKVVA